MQSVDGEDFLRILLEYLNKHERELNQGTFKLTLNPACVKFLSTRLSATGKALTRALPNMKKQPLNHNEVLDLKYFLEVVRFLRVDPAKQEGLEDKAELEFGLFTALNTLELIRISPKCLVNKRHLSNQVERIIVRESISSLAELLQIDIDEDIKDDSEHWTKLKDLDCGHNKISLIDESLVHLSGVKRIDLSYNSIERIENLQFCYSLEYLNLSVNKIINVENTGEILGNLKILILKGNGLKSTEGLEKLMGLEKLDLSDNVLSSMQEVKRIRKLPLLSQLWLQGNPISYLEIYRKQTLLYFLSESFVLDGKPITSSDLSWMRKQLADKAIDLKAMPVRTQISVSTKSEQDKPVVAGKGQSGPSPSINNTNINNPPPQRRPSNVDAPAPAPRKRAKVKRVAEIETISPVKTPEADRKDRKEPGDQASTAPVSVTLPVPNALPGQAKSEGDASNMAVSPSVFGAGDAEIAKYRDDIINYKNKYGTGWLVVLDQYQEQHTADPSVIKRRKTKSKNRNNRSNDDDSVISSSYQPSSSSYFPQEDNSSNSSLSSPRSTMGSFSENYDRIGTSAGTFNSLPASAFKDFDEQLKPSSSYKEPSLNKNADNADTLVAKNQRSLDPSPMKKKPRMIVPAIAIVHQKQLPVPIRRDTTASIAGSFDDRQSVSGSLATEAVSPAATSPDLRDFTPQLSLVPNPALEADKSTVARKLSFASSTGDTSDTGSENSDNSIPSRQNSAGSIPPPITLVEPKSLLSTQLQADKEDNYNNTVPEKPQAIPRVDSGNDLDLDQITIHEDFLVETKSEKGWEDRILIVTNKFISEGDTNTGGDVLKLHLKNIVSTLEITPKGEEHPIIKLDFQSGGEIDSHQYRMENQAEAAKLLNVLTEQLGIGEKKLRCMGCEMTFDIGSKVDKCPKCGSTFIVAFDKREEELKQEDKKKQRNSLTLAGTSFSNSFKESVMPDEDNYLSMEENSLNDPNQQLYFRLNFFKESDENFVHAFKTTYLPFNSAIKQEVAVAVILSSMGVYIVQRKTSLLAAFKSDSQPGT
jgi:hypothetical protein